MERYLETDEFLYDIENSVRGAFVTLFNEYYSRLYMFSYKMTENGDKASAITTRGISRTV